MSVKRRLGLECAKNRELLIDATALILHEEGYAAITARRVAERAGLKAQLVYYYFESMDDLIRAVIRKYSSMRLERLNEAVASSDPFRMLWELNSDPVLGISGTELMALAHHRESVREELVAVAREFRSLQIKSVEKLLVAKGIDQKKYPAAVIVTIVAALARAMGKDCSLGVDEGYAEALKFVEQGLEFLSRAKPSKDESAEQ